MKILIPLDGSELALEAVHFALRLVRDGLQASFVLANVQEPTHFYEVVLAHDAALVERASRAAGADALLAGEALLHAAGLAFEREVAIGDPANTLIEIAERHACDAVLIAARGRGALSSALLGSVSREVLQASPVPVMIVKRAEPAGVEDEGETSP